MPKRSITSNTRSHKPSIAKVIAHTLNPFVALVSQIPHIYAAIDYNNDTLKIPIAIVVGIGGAVLPLRSIQLTINRYFEYFEAKELGIDIKEKEAFIQKLNKAKGTFVNLTEEEQRTFIDQLNEIKKLPDNPKKIQQFWSKILDVSSSSEVETHPKTSPLYAIKATGLAITAIYQYVIGIYTFDKTQEEVWDNKAFAGVLSGIVVASSQFLIGSAIVDSTVRIFENVTGINKQARLQNRQLVEKLRSKSLIPLIGLGIVINLLSLGVTATIWNDFFTDPKQKIAFETLMCVAIFLLIDAAIPALIKDIVSNHVKTHGTQEEKVCMHQIDEYQTIMDLIAKMPLQDFQEFIENIPRDIKDAPSDIYIINTSDSSPLLEHA